MGGKSNIRNLGRAILLGSAAGLTLQACQVPANYRPVLVQRTTPQSQAYNEALATRSPQLVANFIRSYPRSSDSATLLNQMPNGVLAQIPRSAVTNLSDSVKRRLSARVRGQFGITLSRSTVPEPRTGGGGYRG